MAIIGQSVCKLVLQLGFTLIPKSDSFAGDPSSKAFVLRSLLPAKLRNIIDTGKTELSQALAMVVLPLIALSGGKLTEGALPGVFLSCSPLVASPCMLLTVTLQEQQVSFSMHLILKMFSAHSMQRLHLRATF